MEETLLQKLSDKFTKANLYAVIQDMINNGECEITLEQLAETVKPQKGGGASANPPKDIDGVTYHYCRYKDDYVPESEINMTGGKSKGTSKLASKVAYRIGRAADDLKAEALKAFTTGDYAKGAELNAQADELAKTIEDPATFTDEAMAVSIYHPNYGKDENDEANCEDESSDEIL